MSFINDIQHSYLGDLFGLPLMHPIDSVSEELHTRNLVLGGRFAEHSAFVIKDIENCLEHYIAFRFLKRLSPPAEYACHWTIEEAYNAYPQIKSFMNRVGVSSSPEYAVILAVGDYIFSLAKAFSEDLGLISEDQAERVRNLEIEPWNLVDTPATPGVLGRVELAGGTVLGISLVEEIKYADQIRPCVDLSMISKTEFAIIKANTNMKFFMKEGQ